MASHDDAGLVARILSPMPTDAADGRRNVVRVGNGYQDATVDVAPGVPDVRVLELPEPSKEAGPRATPSPPRGLVGVGMCPQISAVNRARPLGSVDHRGGDPVERRATPWRN
jgi:hypothetical protein